MLRNWLTPSDLVKCLRQHKNWETTQWLTFHYDLFSKTICLKNAMSKRKYCCYMYVWKDCKIVGIQFLFKKRLVRIIGIVAGNIKLLPQNVALRQWILWCTWQWLVTHLQHTHNVLFCFHCRIITQTCHSVTLYLQLPTLLNLQ